MSVLAGAGARDGNQNEVSLGDSDDIRHEIDSWDVGGGGVKEEGDLDRRLVVGGGRSEGEKRGALARSIAGVAERGWGVGGVAIELLVVFVLLLRLDSEAKREEEKKA